MAAKRIGLIALLLFAAAIIIMQQVNHIRLEKLLEISESITRADKIEIIGYRNEPVVINQKEDIDRFLRVFLPLLGVNSQKKVYKKYLTEEYFSVTFTIPDGPDRTFKFFKLSDKLQEDKKQNDLYTILINNHDCIAVIENQFCQVFPLDTDNKELLDSFLDCP